MSTVFLQLAIFTNVTHSKVGLLLSRLLSTAIWTAMPFVQLAIFTLIIHSKVGLQLSGPLSTVNCLPSAGVTLRESMWLFGPEISSGGDTGHFTGVTLIHDDESSTYGHKV